jgi:hypothetical protein
VLAAYTSLRAVTAEHGTLDPKVSWALNLATAATVGNDCMVGIASRFARVNGWAEAQIAALELQERFHLPREPLRFSPEIFTITFVGALVVR